MFDQVISRSVPSGRRIVDSPQPRRTRQLLGEVLEHPLMLTLGVGKLPGALQPPAPTDPGVTVSRHRALLTSRSARADPLPVGEQAGLSFEQPGPPPFEPLVGPQPSVLFPGPAPQVETDAPQEGIQRRPVEPAVVVHPPGDDGVQPSRQVVQRQVGAPVDPQLAEPDAFGFERLGTDRRQESGEVLPVLRRASRGRKAKPRKVNEVCPCSP